MKQLTCQHVQASSFTSSP